LSHFLDTNDLDEIAGDFLTASDLYAADRARKRTRKHTAHEPRRARNRLTRPPRTDTDQAFKCGHCKQFIGAPAVGGRHRNHCPNCLHSRHVDGNRPGDRRSDCHALMLPVGVISRRNGEQVIIHRCLGCGKEDPNRIAADDNPVALMKLPPVAPAGLGVIFVAIDEFDEQTA
jgi:hypothetical protein